MTPHIYKDLETLDYVIDSPYARVVVDVTDTTRPSKEIILQGYVTYLKILYDRGMITYSVMDRLRILAVEKVYPRS